MKTSNPDSHFGRTFRQLREASGLTVEEFCRQYNARFDGRMNKSTVSRYENSLQEPMISTVKKVAVFFSVDPSDLLGYSVDVPAAPALSPELAALSAALDQLNEEGREKLLDYAADLVAGGRYIKSGASGLGQAQA
jgi:transcriptional regulator with XRE-family HTH domain